MRIYGQKIIEQQSPKYANDRRPLYLQEKKKQYGAQINYTTLLKRIIYCSQNYFQPIYVFFHRELLKHSLAMADETRVHVLNKEGHKTHPSYPHGRSGVVKVDFRRLSCMAISLPKAVAMQRSSWMDTTDI